MKRRGVIAALLGLLPGARAQSDRATTVIDLSPLWTPEGEIDQLATEELRKRGKCCTGMVALTKASQRRQSAPRLPRRQVDCRANYFTDEVDAATAYNFAAEELHGEFAWFNRPIKENGLSDQI